MSSVSPTTVKELLLREADEVPSGAVVHPLQGPGGGEGPAGSTGTLILDRSHRSLLSPVHMVG